MLFNTLLDNFFLFRLCLFNFDDGLLRLDLHLLISMGAGRLLGFVNLIAVDDLELRFKVVFYLFLHLYH